MRRLSTALVSLALISPAISAEAPQLKTSIGRTIENFSLRDFRGKAFELDELKDKPVVVVAFLGTECPLVNLYTARLREMSVKYGARGVAFVAINANVQDSISEMAHWAKEHKLEFPVLKDVGNKVADQFAAQRTPEVFVLDDKRVVRYQGRIDDQYGIGYQRPKATASYLADAIDALLAGKLVTTAQTEPVGCYIGRTSEPDATSEVTYSKQIARILQKRCVVCHREGEIAPFALTKYEEVAGWAEAINEVIQDGIMPPWHASDKHGPYYNDPRLSADAKEQIKKWVRAGAPEGDKKDLPEPRKFTDGWRIPKPDLVIPIQNKPFDVPATGEVKYQYFTVDPGFTEDKWVRAAECRAGNRTVVHHIIAFVRSPGDGPRMRNHTIESDWLVATAPGAAAMVLPQGYAKFIPAGSKLVFQVHYTPNGTPQKDQSELGLVFVDAKTVKKEVGTWRAVNPRFKIPPGAANHEVTASHTFRKDTILMAMFPHMHLRGKSFRYEARFPDGRSEVLLDIPRYDFGWQNNYVPLPPRLLPAGTRLVCTAHFDNSAANPNNPDPTATVRWGDQTWEEMMIGYFSMVLADQDLTKGHKIVRRTDMFLERAKAKPMDVEDVIAKLAGTLKSSDAAENLYKFTLTLQDYVPQIDRVDLVVVDGEKLEILLDAHPAELDPHLLGRGAKLPAAKLALAAHAKVDKPVTYDVLSKEKASDLRFMSRGFASSHHVPVKIDGKPGAVNFWSEEPHAFPPEVIELLRRAAELIAKPH
jgi:peroxiredoxin